MSQRPSRKAGFADGTLDQWRHEAARTLLRVVLWGGLLAVVSSVCWALADGNATEAAVVAAAYVGFVYAMWRLRALGDIGAVVVVLVTFLGGAGQMWADAAHGSGFQMMITSVVLAGLLLKPRAADWACGLALAAVFCICWLQPGRGVSPALTRSWAMSWSTSFAVLALGCYLPLRYVVSRLVSALGEARDHLAAREELIARLGASNAELERFAYTVSHDLKSPLITIRGFVGRMRRDVDLGQVAQLPARMTRIESAADHMARLLDELLDLARIGRVAQATQPVPLSEVVSQALILVAGRRAERGLEHEGFDIEPLPTVQGDAPRLVEVYQNLLDNALRFGGRHITVGCAGSDSASGWTLLFVRDDGQGFDPAYAERIFRLFEQLDPTDGGTGVGLALVSRIIEVHGGRIWAESAGPGQGACFWFTLPPANGDTP